MGPGVTVLSFDDLVAVPVEDLCETIAHELVVVYDHYCVHIAPPNVVLFGIEAKVALAYVILSEAKSLP